MAQQRLDRDRAGILPRLRIKIPVSKNDIANKTQNMSSKLQYISSHATNCMTVKRVIADTFMIADAKQQTRTKCAFRIAGFAVSHITGKLPSSKDGATEANTLMSPCHKGEQRRASQCSGHVYRLDLLLRQQQNVKCVQA